MAYETNHQEAFTPANEQVIAAEEQVSRLVAQAKVYGFEFELAEAFRTAISELES